MHGTAPYLTPEEVAERERTKPCRRCDQPKDAHQLIVTGPRSSKLLCPTGLYQPPEGT